MRMTSYSSAQVRKIAGVTERQISYWSKRKLFERPQVKPGKCRIWTEGAIFQLRLIRRMRAMRFYAPVIRKALKLQSAAFLIVSAGRVSAAPDAAGVIAFAKKSSNGCIVIETAELRAFLQQ